MTVLAEAPPILGKTEPRLWTPPLRDLTPETSYGFEVIGYARDVLGQPLLPWQEFAVIHGGELLPDGRPRFRIVLLLVSRQNGKTHLPVILSVYWQFKKRVPLILGTSTQLSYAKESWLKAVNLVQRTRALDSEHEPGRKWVRRTNGETESFTGYGCRYKIAAANEEGGRSLTVHRGIADELRQHHTYEAWGAMEPACSPMDAQLWGLSNAGDDRSVVLNELRQSAIDFIDTGVGDRRLGLLEWSAPEDADPEDMDALLQANPRAGYGLDPEVLLGDAQRAKRIGGKALATFKTEKMCVRVRHLDPAIDPQRWRDCLDPGELSDARSRLATFVDVSLDEQHVTLAGAAVLADDRVRVEAIKEWTGPTAVSQMEREMPVLMERIKPKAFGWFPSGPAAVAAARMADRRKDGVYGWPPRGVTVAAVRGEVAAACMALGKEVTAGTLAHSGQAGLDDQVSNAEWLPRGDMRVFTRRGVGSVDAVYAIAGAAHLARTLPKSRKVSSIVRTAEES
ncbi:MAG: terminase [Micromonosporaceae bacterium]|nr:terminase [Micromonosporaceae bacterium]